MKPGQNYTLVINSVLNSQVDQIQDDSRNLQAAYAGDKAKEITNREAEVVNAWRNLQSKLLFLLTQMSVRYWLC